MVFDLTKKQSAIAVGLLTAVGALLRFYRLDFQGLWYDELHSIIGAAPTQTLSQVIEYCKRDQPPAFFLYLFYWLKIFGNTELSAKAASALIGVLAIPATYFLAKECKDRNVGVIAALIVTFNYFSIYYSQELRFYSFAYLFSTLSFTFFIRGLKNKQTLDFVLYSLFTSILLYTHYFGIVIFASQVIAFVAICFIQKSKVFIIKGFVAGIVTGLSFTPWLPVIFNDLQIASFWIQRPKATFLGEYFYGYVGKDFVVAFVFVLLLYFFFKKIKAESTVSYRKAIIIALLLSLAMSYVIPVTRSLTSTPILHVRYTIVSLPLWIVLFAWGWSLLPNWKLKIAMPLVIVLSSLFNLFFMRKHYHKITKQQFREAATVVKDKLQPGQRVMTTFPWHYSFYFQEHGIVPEQIDVSVAESFWLLPVQTFNAQEIEDEINKFPNFVVKERHRFNKTEAILMTNGL